MSLAAKLWERSQDWVIFAVLFVMSAMVLVKSDGPTLRAVRATSLAVTGPVEGLFAGMGRYRQSLGENDRLRAETIELATEVARLREARAENERLRSLLAFNDSSAVQRVPARVVAKDITQQQNLLTLNVGSQSGVEIGMPVIDERGLVGKVVLTSSRYCIVMPHQSTQFAVPATIDALQQDGIVRWDGVNYDRLLMEYVPKTEPVQKGQVVTTSGYSEVFPAGVPVGVVDSVFAGQGRNDFMIYLRPSAPISQVNYVYVLLARPDPERLAVEEEARVELTE